MFKIGDRVRVIEDGYWQGWGTFKGETGTIQALYPSIIGFTRAEILADNKRFSVITTYTEDLELLVEDNKPLPLPG